MEPDQLYHHLKAFLDTELRKAASVRNERISEAEKVLSKDISKCQEEKDKMVNKATTVYQSKMNRGIEINKTLAKELGTDHMESSSEDRHESAMDDKSAYLSEAMKELKGTIKNISEQFTMWKHSVHERAGNNAEAANEEYERLNKDIMSEMTKLECAK
jgi:response regulator RpfG family c-di-GMP phosphodiesterase